MIDYLAFTFPDGLNLEDIQELFGSRSWSPLGHGMMGYRSAMMSSHILILSDGQPGMGLHVICTGQACRMLELENVVTEWSTFLTTIRERGASITRIDIANDDKTGIIPLAAVEQAIMDDLETVSTHFRTYKIDMSGKRGQGIGKTFYFGHRSSEAMVRIYDKAQEQGVNSHWVRVEMEFKGDKARQVAAMIEEGRTEELAGVLRGLLDFKVPNPAQKERSRWRTVEWWADFLDNAKKVRFEVVKQVEKTIDEVRQWLFKQVAPSLAVLVEYAGGNFGDLLDMVDSGRYRLKPHHRMMLANAGVVTK